MNMNMNIPRNSSVENFWMLVDMGDLPRPDQGVLSETLWQAKSASKSDFPAKSGNSSSPSDEKIIEKKGTVHLF